MPPRENTDLDRRRTAHCRLCTAYEKGIRWAMFDAQDPGGNPSLKGPHDYPPQSLCEGLFNLAKHGVVSAQFMDTRRSPACHACTVFDLGIIESPTKTEPRGDWKVNAAKHGYQPDSFEWLLYRMGYVTSDESR